MNYPNSGCRNMLDMLARLPEGIQLQSAAELTASCPWRCQTAVEDPMDSPRPSVLTARKRHGYISQISVAACR